MGDNDSDPSAPHTWSAYVLALSLVLAVPVLVWQAATLRWLWDWFMPRALPGAAATHLSLGVGIGLMCVFHLARGARAGTKQTSTTASVWTAAGIDLVWATGLLVIGLGVHALL
ncbi:hypothetical protein [Nocardia sp. GAS34]|uniref:hypothetical protein n=1 Tax=unclassified Nocardia TaxID=2637762 RepID=UPI003D2388E9